MIRLEFTDPAEAADHVDALLIAAATVRNEDPARAQRYQRAADHLGDQLDQHLPIPTGHTGRTTT